MKVGLTYDLKESILTPKGVPDDALEEYDSEETVEAISEVVAALSHTVVKLGGGPDLLSKIVREEIDFVFNIAEGRGIYRSREAQVPSMLEMLDVQEGMKVLEVGVGCGYVAALLSELVGEKGKVFGIDIVKELMPIAKKNLKAQDSKNVKIFSGDGSKGLEKQAPFDRIIISAACPFIPKPLADQLKEKGIVVAPVGDRFNQAMTKFTKFKGKLVKSTYPGGMFVFVPLKGEFGWK